MLGYSVKRKSNDRKIYAKRFILFMHDGIIFYEYVASPRALDTSAQTQAVASRRRSLRSIGICEVNRRLSRLYHGILSRGTADKDSSQFTVMPSPAGKTREGNPVPRFSSRHIPNLDGDRLPFQCPALVGYHAPRACT